MRQFNNQQQGRNNGYNGGYTGGRYNNGNFGGINGKQLEEIRNAKEEIAKNNLRLEKVVNACTHRGSLTYKGTDSEGNDLFKCKVCGKVIPVTNMTKDEVIKMMNKLISIIDVCRLLGPELTDEMNKRLTETITAASILPRVYEEFIEPRLANGLNNNYDKRGNGSFIPPVNRNGGNLMGNNIGGYQQQPGGYGIPTGDNMSFVERQAMLNQNAMYGNGNPYGNPNPETANWTVEEI